jgi:hypothetical protein
MEVNKMISKQELFGAGDLRANEELKGTGKKENALTKEWILEESEEIVREGLTSGALKAWINGDATKDYAIPLSGADDKTCHFGACIFNERNGHIICQMDMCLVGADSLSQIAIIESHVVFLEFAVIQKSETEESEYEYELGSVLNSWVDSLPV